MQIRLRHLAVPLLVIALTGCGGGNEPVSAPATSKPADARYDTAQDLVAAMERAGVKCTDYIPRRSVTGALTRGDCTIDGKSVVVSLYASKSDAEAAPQRLYDLSPDDVTMMVVGENWTVNCVLVNVCEPVEAATGGKLVRIP